MHTAVRLEIACVRRIAAHRFPFNSNLSPVLSGELPSAPRSFRTVAVRLGVYICLFLSMSGCGARGAMDNASDYGSEDSRFESWRARFFI